MRSIKFCIPFILLPWFILNAQDKTYQFEIKKGRTLTNITSSKVNGFQYIKTGQQVVMAKFKDDKLFCLDNNLNVQYSVSVNSNDHIGNPNYEDMSFVSKYGDYYNNVDQIINLKGKVVEYPGTVKGGHKAIRKQSKLNRIFSFFSDFGYSIIGPEIGRKNYKKKYSAGDLSIFTLKHDGLIPLKGVMETPNIKNNDDDDAISWYKKEVFKEKFVLSAREEIEEANKRDNYHLAEFDFEGKLLREIILNFTIKENYILPSKCWGMPSVNDNLNGVSYSNVYINEKEDTYTIYGYFTESDKKLIKGGKAYGVFLYKYNSQGDLIWNKKYPFSKPQKGYLIHRIISYSENISTGFLRFSTELNEESLLLIDNKNGDVKKNYLNLFDNYKINRVNVLKRELQDFDAIFGPKAYKKKYFSISVVHEINWNSEVKDYISSRSSNSTLYYDGDRLYDGSYILKEFDKEGRKIKLMKFNSQLK